jgi:hypothetical protein
MADGSGAGSARQVLSGVPELVMLTWALLSMLSLGICGRDNLASVVDPRMAAVLLLVTGLTGAQIWPFWDLLQHSQRDRAFASAKWSMPVSGLANLLVPLFHSFHTPQGIFFQVGQQFLSSTYLGIGVLALAAYALVFAETNRFGVGRADHFQRWFCHRRERFFYRTLKQLVPMGFYGIQSSSSFWLCWWCRCWLRTRSLT